MEGHSPIRHPTTIDPTPTRVDHAGERLSINASTPPTNQHPIAINTIVMIVAYTSRFPVPIARAAAMISSRGACRATTSLNAGSRNACAILDSKYK